MPAMRNQNTIMKITFILFLALGSLSITNAQKKDISKKSIQQQLVGAWSLVAVDNIYPDSSRVQPYGDHPQGMLVFDAQGNYAVQILKADRPKVLSGDKNKCTPEEYAALVQGSNSHFGSYTIDEATHTITFFIEHASFPNWEGTQQKRLYTYTDDGLKYVVTNTTQGGQSVVAEVAWKRKK